MIEAALPFAVWRDEIVAELAETQVALAEATEDLRAAEAAHEAARVQHQAIRDAIAVLRPPVASAIAQRIRHADEAAHGAAAAAARARGTVVGLRERVADIEQALHEVAQLMAPAVAAGEEKEQADA